MNKLKKTSDCPHRDNICGKYFCDHPSMLLRFCSCTANFPDGCPLKREEKQKEKENFDHVDSVL